MNGGELSREYERLKQRVADVLADKPSSGARDSESLELLERLGAITQQYAEKLADAEVQITDGQAQIAEARAQIAEAQAQIADLKRELFGPKADQIGRAHV